LSGRVWKQVRLLEGEITAREWGKMKKARGSELPKKSGKMKNEGERVVDWAQELK
jgi:hypothetical protein